MWPWWLVVLPLLRLFFVLAYTAVADKTGSTASTASTLLHERLMDGRGVRGVDWVSQERIGFYIFLAQSGACVVSFLSSRVCVRFVSVCVCVLDTPSEYNARNKIRKYIYIFMFYSKSLFSVDVRNVAPIPTDLEWICVCMWLGDLRAAAVARLYFLYFSLALMAASRIHIVNANVTVCSAERRGDEFR